MSQKAAEIAKDLAVAAVRAQPAVLQVRSEGRSTDAQELGNEVAKVFLAAYDAIKSTVPGD